MSRFDATWHWLQWWTKGRTPSERMAAQIIEHEGYKEVILTHPTGGPDDGADATCVKDDQKCVMAAYFPVGPKTLPTVERKLKADLKAARDADREFSRLVFVTNQRITVGQRKKLEKLGGDVDIDLFELERCTHILDTPDMAKIKEQYLDIPADKPPLLVAVDVIGEARYIEDGQELLDVLVGWKRDQLRMEAQKQKDNPFSPWEYKAMWNLYSFGNAPEEPPKPKTEDEIEDAAARFQAGLEGHWQQSLDYLASAARTALRFRISNGEQSFLKNVQVIITFEDAEGVDDCPPEVYRFEKFLDPEWRERDFLGHTVSLLDTNLRWRGYPIKWRNSEGNLRVIITLPELRPEPTWESEEECDDDIVLLLRESDIERVTATYTVTAENYGQAFRGELTMPVERMSALNLFRAVEDNS